MGYIQNITEQLRKLEIKMLRDFIDLNGDVIIKERNPDSDEHDYYYPDDDQINIACWMPNDGFLTNIVVHQVLKIEGKYYIVYSIYEDINDNSYVDAYVDQVEYDLTFPAGQLEYLLEEIKERIK